MNAIILGIVAFFLFFSLLGNGFQFLYNDYDKYKDHENVNVLSKNGFDWNVKTGPIIANALDFQCPPEPVCPPCDKEECPKCPLIPMCPPCDKVSCPECPKCSTQSITIGPSGGMSEPDLMTLRQLLLYMDYSKRDNGNCIKSVDKWKQCTQRYSDHIYYDKFINDVATNIESGSGSGRLSGEYRKKFENIITKYGLPIR